MHPYRLFLLSFSRPTQHVSAYRTAIDSDPLPAARPAPIRVVTKPKKRKRSDNVFYDDRGFPDQSDEFDSLLHNIDGGSVLRKRQHSAPPLDDIDPAFATTYVDAIHGERLRSELDLSHLDPSIQTQVLTLIKKYWSVFDDKGLFVPVKNYECIIDTGNARPITVRKIHYGPREIPIMRNCIAKLEELGHIRQIHDGPWLFKALLAPKPHQEHISDIKDFVWRFCVNFIPLNQITRIISYPIPRCDSAVHLAFGDGTWMWLFDAPQGYHQIRVAAESQTKLSFAGPDATKYCYNVMPFGPVNGPAIFITFIHDIDSSWKADARDEGVIIDEDTNTKIIVDDILSWSTILSTALAYMECQLRRAQCENLSLSLRKTHIFPKRFEFVGIDVCIDGNRPAMSKRQLLLHWPGPEIVRDVAKFVGFILFYGRYIPHCEIRLEPLRTIMAHEYDEPLGTLWTAHAAASMESLKVAFLDDPCTKRFDHRKLLVLMTDFSTKGFGYVACQPGDDDESQAAMREFMRGGQCEFLKKGSKIALHPIAFGSRRTRGNETRLHSYLGEGFAGDHAINKNRHYCFGMRFLWITDCYAIRFILSYDGTNPAILRLQMRLMCWDMDIQHRNADWLEGPDYFSRLLADLCFDPLLRDYIQRAQSLRSANAPVSELPMRAENMPYYRGPRLPANNAQPSAPSSAAPSSDAAVTVTLAAIHTHNSGGLTHLANWPVHFGSSPTVHPDSTRALYNADIPAAARQLAGFDWAIYGFNSGHFISTIRSRNLPFSIVLACDPYEPNRALFREFAPSCKTVLSGANALLDHVRGSGVTSALHGYIIHSHRYSASETTSRFWQLQASILKQLRLTRSLSIFVAFVHPDHDGRSVDLFVHKIIPDGWEVSITHLSFPDYGDSVAGTCRAIIGVHVSTASDVMPIQLRTPPSTPLRRLADFIWAPFNRPEMSISFGKDDPSFNMDAHPHSNAPKLVPCEPLPNAQTGTSTHLKIKYHLLRDGCESEPAIGSSVYSMDSLCPTFQSSPTSNIFQHYFGVEFLHDAHTYVRAISPFEFATCFGLVDDLSYHLSRPENRFALDAAIPAVTSAWVFDHIIERMVTARDSNCELFDPSHHAAPAATAMSFLSGAVGVRIPDRDRWHQAYKNDTACRAVISFINNPGSISNQAMIDADVHYTLRGPLRQSQLVLEDGFIIFREPIRNYDSYTRLTLVPREFYSIIFTAFHANAIGGHFNAYRTLHRIRMRFFWPGMFQYIRKMCRACPGCALKNPTQQRSSELIYNFPIESPFQVLHVDGYQAGAHAGFEGSKVYLIACCGMCTFAVMEPIQKANATSFASAIMKIQLRFGFSHTIVVDKDSKFYGVFRESIDLLKINLHVLSGDNHNPMLVERINRYLNAGLKIMTNERDSVRIALEAILLLIYAWNSCPVPGTDISRSFVAVGREFNFPIDFATNQHWKLTSSPSTVQSYSRLLAERLDASLEIAKLLVHEQRAWHRELVNSRRRDPRLYDVGDLVFAHRSTKSDSRRGRVGKLMYPFTGPWRITAKSAGASYELAHELHKTKTDKKHAADLCPYPEQLSAFEPVDGPDNQYSQLYKRIGEHPFIQAGLKGFGPAEPFKLASNFVRAGHHTDFHWPSLSELNNELNPYPWTSDAERDEYLPADDEVATSAVLYTGPPPAPPAYVPPAIPPISDLVASIISSDSKLFFIADRLNHSDAREWRLVRVALQDSISSYPACLQDGKFLVEFYIGHTADVRYNAINQRYWIQYHRASDIVSPSSSSETHLIRPSDTSVAYASRHNLLPFRKWVNITHLDTYIHGPFDFAAIRGRKSRDRISQHDWEMLSSHKSMFHNPVPSFELPSYSIHVDRGAHVSFINSSFEAQASSTANCSSLFDDTAWEELQKVFLSLPKSTP